MNDRTFMSDPVFDRDAIDRLSDQFESWERNEVASFIAKAPERRSEFRTLGGLAVKRVYTPLDLADRPFVEVGLLGR